jgi:hypothetical protein
MDVMDVTGRSTHREKAGSSQVKSRLIVLDLPTDIEKGLKRPNRKTGLSDRRHI